MADQTYWKNTINKLVQDFEDLGRKHSDYALLQSILPEMKENTLDLHNRSFEDENRRGLVCSLRSIIRLNSNILDDGKIYAIQEATTYFRKEEIVDEDMDMIIYILMNGNIQLFNDVRGFGELHALSRHDGSNELSYRIMMEGLDKVLEEREG